MAAERLQLASNLTRFISGITQRRVRIRGRYADHSGIDLLVARTWRSDEGARRAGVLSELYRHHAVETAGENGELSYSDTLPPDAWVNAQLETRGEGWRVHNVDGFRCEIYEV